METKEVTTKEAELIDAIRYLKSTRHNPSRQLEIYARQLFNIMVDEAKYGKPFEEEER